MSFVSIDTPPPPQILLGKQLPLLLSQAAWWDFGLLEAPINDTVGARV